MLFQATNISPSNLGEIGNGTVDATQEITVSWQVNGNSPMTKYRIVVMKNDTSSTQVYDSGVIPLSAPFYGTDYAGNVQMFTTSIPVTSSITNGNEYKMTITQYWSDTGYVTQSSASVFITRATPTLSITYPSSSVSAASITAQAAYNQADGDTISSARWTISLKNGTTYTLLKDTGNIYGTSELKFEYDGLFDGYTYGISCTVETEHGVAVTTGYVDFSVSYSQQILRGKMTAKCIQSDSAVELTMPDIKDIPASVTGSPTYSDSVITLESGDSVSYSNINGETYNITDNAYIMYRGEASGENASALKLEGDFLLNKHEYSTPLYYFSAAYGAGYCIIIDDFDSSAYYSTDFSTWTRLGDLPDSNYGAVCYHKDSSGNEYFVAVSHTNPQIAYIRITDLALNANFSTFDIPKRRWTSISSNSVYNTLMATSSDSNYVLFPDISIETYREKEVPTSKTYEQVGFSRICNFGKYTILARGSAMSYKNPVFIYCWSFGYLGDWDSRLINIQSVEENGIRYIDFNSDSSTLTVCGASLAVIKEGLYGLTNIEFKPYPGSRPSIFFANIGGLHFVSTIESSYISSDYINWIERDVAFAAPEAGTLVSSTEDGFVIFAAYNANNYNTEIHKIKRASNISYGFSNVDGSSANVGIYADGELFDSASAASSGFITVVSSNNNTISTSQDEISGVIPLSITNVSLKNEQLCDYFFISDCEIGEYVKSKIMRDATYHPISDNNVESWMLYADYATGTNAGSLEGFDLTGFSIYRRDGVGSILHHICDIEKFDKYIYDYSAASQQEYFYYALGIGDSTFSTARISLASQGDVETPVIPCFWNWCLIVCEKLSNGYYKPKSVYLFSLNVSSGSVSNNSALNILQNFTQFPTVQHSPWNYRSGTLESLIGGAVNGEYINDTISLQKSLYALSTSQDAMFLKDRKGNIMRISLSGAITMTTSDNDYTQSQSIRLPWVEIGDSTNESIYRIVSE